EADRDVRLSRDQHAPARAGSERDAQLGVPIVIDQPLKAVDARFGRAGGRGRAASIALDVPYGERVEGIVEHHAEELDEAVRHEGRPGGDGRGHPGVEVDLYGRDEDRELVAGEDGDLD